MEFITELTKLCSEDFKEKEKCADEKVNNITSNMVAYGGICMTTMMLPLAMLLTAIYVGERESWFHNFLFAQPSCF